MDWQKKVSLLQKVETCAFKKHKKEKNGDKICAIASPNVSPGSVGMGLGRMH
jgi:hypothetical protein